MYILISVYNEH